MVGYLWARTFITRIFALKRATLAIGEGRFDERVALTGDDELKQLGDSFNSMADSIVQLQEDVRKQERQAMFGRIAAGLVHDLSHPIQNIGNSCKLIQKMYDDLSTAPPSSAPWSARWSWSSGCSTTCATSPGRFRSNGSRSKSIGPWAKSSNRCSSMPKPPA